MPFSTIPVAPMMIGITSVMERIIPPGKIEYSFNLLKGKKMSD